MSLKDSLKSNSLEEETDMKKLSLTANDIAIAFDFKTSDHNQLLSPEKLSDEVAGRGTSRFMTVKE